MEKQILEIEDIKRILPQRYPFLMIDRVVEASPEKVVAIKNVSINEEYFKGHFPGKAVMPGALIIEAMAQAGIVLYRKTFSNSRIVYLGALKVRFFEAVLPGSQLRIEAMPKKMLVSGGIIEILAMVADKKVAQMEMAFSAKDE